MKNNMTLPCFYENHPPQILRFGDVLSGFVLSATSIKSPTETRQEKQYRIDVKAPEHVVVLSPCCSIGDKTLALSPLLPILPQFFKNPYLGEDVTRINRMMTPEQSVSPTVWGKLSQKEIARRFRAGPKAYAFVEYFVYEKHDLLPLYPLPAGEEGAETNYYMVDFRRIYRIECNKVASPKDAPLETKLLGLSIPARAELRKKLASYFSRVPDEDII